MARVTARVRSGNGMVHAIANLNAALEGRYRIERELGEGGMATVYLAEDLKHERKVALKVLKPDLAAVVGGDRFLAEIKTTANLQHPHILPLYDSGESDGLLFYVMPFVEGESLRERLDREHQLPVDDAVGISTNVAEALDYAHRQGVIHRDIKPDNILLLDGKAVVSDFGIALALSAGGGNRITETGLSLGTPHYMSPEQATGDLNVGSATDIWASGCVLYEMLVGEPPFVGSTPQAILGKIITGDRPSAKTVRPSVYPHVDAVIAKSLEKVPADRFATPADMAAALEATEFRWGGPEGPTGLLGAERGRRFSLLLVLLVLTLSAVLFVVWSGGGSPTTPLRFAQILLPGDVAPSESAGGNLAITEDGSRIVYLAESEDGSRELRLRLLLERDSDIPIPGTEGANGFFLSPDGQTVAFHDLADLQLKTVPVSGGRPTVVARTGAAAQFVGGTWGRDGTIVFATTRSGLWRVPAGGGVPEEITEAGEETTVRHHHPSFLPDGSGVVFSVSDGAAALDRTYRIAVLRFGEEVVELTEVGEGSSPTVTDQGILVYARGGNLWAARLRADFDGIEGAPRRVMSEAPRASSASYPRVPYAIAGDGSLVFVPDGALGELDLTIDWVDRDGNSETILDQDDVPNSRGGVLGLRLSPDGSRIAFRSNVTVPARNFSLFVWDLDRSTLTPIPGEANADWPVWWGDDRLVFNRFDSEGQDLYWTRADGRSTPEPFGPETATQRHPQEFLPDGSALLYQERPRPNHADSDIWLWPVDGVGEPRVVVDDDGAAVQAALDPSGRWLAYSSNISGIQEVYVTGFPEGGGVYKVSEAGGTSPVWSPSGGELFYRGPYPGREMWTARVSTDETFRVEERRLLFEGYFLDCCLRGGWARTFDVSPDGQRFLMSGLRRVATEVARIEWVQGWVQHATRQLEQR